MFFKFILLVNCLPLKYVPIILILFAVCDINNHLYFLKKTLKNKKKEQDEKCWDYHHVVKQMLQQTILALKTLVK